MTFELQGNGGNCNGCEWIAASGEITADTPDAFRAFLADHGQLFLYQAITFDSPGGNLGAAIELGRLLRSARASTAIGRSHPIPDRPRFYEEVAGGRCESACVFAFLGGEARWVYEEKMGIHQFYTPDESNVPTSATQQLMGQLVLFLIEMGISPELLTLASRVPGDRMHYLTKDEISRLGIATTTSVTDMRIEVDHGGLALRWEARNNDGSVDRYQELRCSQQHNAWLLRIVDTGIAWQNVVLSPDNDSNMAIDVAGDTVPMRWSDVLDIGPQGSDFGLTVRLPLDIRDVAGRNFYFRTTDARNFEIVLSARATLPDQTTLKQLTRACGD
ncbi:hypothetical protein [Antarctobacter sp.]|uniref:COG3904 family protein n=1 Tax=Antarctobacter sp. TaxID=1872577 RepID=UPI002B2780B8|nr:hypothetical protein [Antarctobacter sp.]